MTRAMTMNVEWTVATTRASSSVSHVVGGTGNGRAEHGQDAEGKSQVGRSAQAAAPAASNKSKTMTSVSAPIGTSVSTAWIE